MHTHSFRVFFYAVPSYPKGSRRAPEWFPFLRRQTSASVAPPTRRAIHQSQLDIDSKLESTAAKVIADEARPRILYVDS